MYSVQTKTGVSFDIYLNEESTEVEKCDTLYMQFKVLTDAERVVVLTVDYGFVVTCFCKGVMRMFDVVKQ